MDLEEFPRLNWFWEAPGGSEPPINFRGLQLNGNDGQVVRGAAAANLPPAHDDDEAEIAPALIAPAPALPRGRAQHRHADEVGAPAAPNLEAIPIAPVSFSALAHGRAQHRHVDEVDVPAAPDPEAVPVAPAPIPAPARNRAPRRRANQINVPAAAPDPEVVPDVPPVAAHGRALRCRIVPDAGPNAAGVPPAAAVARARAPRR
ncbi:skin secretory protein xP2-like [Copidosoma floridanum]|uniref:skin secretory protein xP2-like n=1 Tax=Copidosoma floridanum TaxID=29053 RepID=UPI0006C9705B|nr:skin secretory protein xP2-like [Copidosoma floridanum]